MRLGMCEISPLGLPHTQNRMSGRPQVAEILLMSSPQTPERMAKNCVCVYYCRTYYKTVRMGGGG